MKQMLLVKFSSNYADEFDVDGFKIMSEEDWEKHVRAATNAFDNQPEASKRNKLFGASKEPVELYFGTNEALEFNDLKEYLGAFVVTKLSSTEHKTLEKLFPSGENGMIVMID